MRVGSAARFQRAIYYRAALNPGGRELRSLPLGFPARHLRCPDGMLWMYSMRLGAVRSLNVLARLGQAERARRSVVQGGVLQDHYRAAGFVLVDGMDIVVFA